MARVTRSETFRSLPALAQVAAIYLVARVVTLSVLFAAAAASGPLSRFGAAATVADFVIGWDANWYWIVADVGYPTELPMSEDGRPMENAWAFMPLYAYLAKAVSLPFGSWAAGAALVSLIPVLLVFMVAQRSLAAGFGAGSGK